MAVHDHAQGHVVLRYLLLLHALDAHLQGSHHVTFVFKVRVQWVVVPTPEKLVALEWNKVLSLTVLMLVANEVALFILRLGCEELEFLGEVRLLRHRSSAADRHSFLVTPVVDQASPLINTRRRPLVFQLESR